LSESPDFSWFKSRVWEMSDEEYYSVHDGFFSRFGFFDWTLTNLPYFEDWVYGDLLEVGCAAGWTLKAVAPRCRRAVGIDISKVALAEAERSGLEVYWADVEKGLPFGDGEFDVVLAGHTLEHLRWPDRAVKEIRRVCRSRVIVLIPLQGEDQRWKRTNTHLQFWPTVESFEAVYGKRAEKALVLRDGTLAVMLFDV